MPLRPVPTGQAATIDSWRATRVTHVLYPHGHVKGVISGQPSELVHARHGLVLVAKVALADIVVRGGGPGVGDLAVVHERLEARAGILVVLVAAEHLESGLDHGAQWRRRGVY